MALTKKSHGEVCRGSSLSLYLGNSVYYVGCYRRNRALVVVGRFSTLLDRDSHDTVAVGLHSTLPYNQ